MAGFDCVATSELSAKRLEIQKINKKCVFDSGYICGDISDDNTRRDILREVARWEQDLGLDEIDVLIATPPCQGMSVANHKKKESDARRNSLVVESIRLVDEIKPRCFIFENVPSFLNTLCTDTDGVDRKIGEAIQKNLGHKYAIETRVLNFKHYGVPSSRTRTLVIGTKYTLLNLLSPYDLIPKTKAIITLQESIGHLRPLTAHGEIDPNDIFHSFRPYPIHMRAWIENLREGESAFSNTDPHRIPHQIINGAYIPNQNKNAGKYTRQFWDKVGPCIHTRNDQLASQNTVHPKDDRVFSIREIMILMTVPNTFLWSERQDLNTLSLADKGLFLKKHEMTIRQSLGEAVPTAIFFSMAEAIKLALSAVQ